LDYVTEDTHREIIKRCNPRYGDILYTNIGVNVGNAVANRLRFEFSLKNVALIQPDLARLDSGFLEALMNDVRFKESALRISSVGGAQKFVSLDVLRGIRIILPSIHIQHKFGTLVDRMRRLCAVQREVLRQAEHLFQTLLHAAFGEAGSIDA
jgi:type I restriction enzyme S subunit